MVAPTVRFDMAVSFCCGRGGIGRHARLKILFPYGSAGSIPAARTNNSYEYFSKYLIYIYKLNIDFCNINISQILGIKMGINLGINVI